MVAWLGISLEEILMVAWLGISLEEIWLVQEFLVYELV